MTAGTRFGSKITFLTELYKPGMYKALGDFAKAHPPGALIRGARAVAGSETRSPSHWRGGSLCASIPLSQATVERSFAILTNRQFHNTLLAGSRYLQNLSMCAVNCPQLVSMYKASMRALAFRPGYYLLRLY